MRPNVSFRRLSKWSAGFALVIAAAAGTSVVARELATGQEVPGREPPPANLTPAPPPPEGAQPITCPEPAPADSVAPAGGPTMDVAGTAIPIPAGASTTSIPPVGADPRTRYQVSLGSSFIVFDERGVIGQDGIAPQDCKVFAPTVASLKAAVANLPPPPLVIDGVSIPIPMGGHSTGPAIGGGWGPEGPPYGIYRGDSFVLFNQGRIIETSVSPTDVVDFQPTFDGIADLIAAVP